MWSVQFSLTCKVYTFQFSHTNIWIIFFQTLNHNQARVITKELEVMNNLNPDELIPRSPHVCGGLCTDSIYVLRHLLCVLWILHISNSITLSEVCIPNFKSIYRVMCSEKSISKSKVRISREYVNWGLTVYLAFHGLFISVHSGAFLAI
jgi:hypothetical protein